MMTFAFSSHSVRVTDVIKKSNLKLDSKRKAGKVIAGGEVGVLKKVLCI